MKIFPHTIYLLFIVMGLFFPQQIDAEQGRTKKEQLVEHVKWSIAQASHGHSKLTADILAIHGFSSSKGRHLLNNLCTYPGTHYLEIGCYHGSTWISALFGNESSISSATAIDDWSGFERPFDKFKANCKKFLPYFPYQFYAKDCFTLDVATAIPAPITIYFYDGEHTELDQEKAFTYYDKVLDDHFIAIVDDWNWTNVLNGTRSAFDKLGYEVLYEKVLPARENGDTENWWNGMYVAVISKKPRAKLEPYSELKEVLPYHMLKFLSNQRALKKLLVSDKKQLSTVIEVGAYLGASSAFFAKLVGNMGRVYAIDWWQGLNYAQMEPVPGSHQSGWGHTLPDGCNMYDQYLSNMIHLNIAHVVYPVRALSHEGAAILLARGVNSADLVYLDADHSYTSVLQDCRTWFPFVSNKRGILCGDDWGWSNPFSPEENYTLGVNRAVTEFAEESNLIVHVDGNFWWLEEK